MLSLSQELNEALDLWASLLPKIQRTPPVEPNQTEPFSLGVPDSLPLLRSMGHFFEQTAWLGEQELEIPKDKAEETSGLSRTTPLQNSVALFFQNTNWNKQENLIQGPEERSLENHSVLYGPGLRLSVNSFFQQTDWQGVSRPETAKPSLLLTQSEEEKATDIDHFFEDIRW